MTLLGPLYHWSPRSRRKQIDRLGLMPGKRNVLGRVPLYEDPDEPGEFLQPTVCFSPTPATAWAYSHAVFKLPGVYDLWEVQLEPSDSVSVLPQWGARIVEVRVANRIPKSRLTWVAERTIP